MASSTTVWIRNWISSTYTSDACKTRKIVLDCAVRLTREETEGTTTHSASERAPAPALEAKARLAVSETAEGILVAD